MFWKIAALVILAVFYAIYLGKLFAQKKKGIQTDQIARCKRKGRRYYIELVMKVATYGVIVAEMISIFLGTSVLPNGVRAVGLIAGIAGDVIFAAAVWTMRDSWRAGIAEQDKTEMVTDGIYRISRNPAFLGFDLMYLSIVLMFFNPMLLAFSLFAAVMLHLQILQEEQYLPTVFGEPYLEYKRTVRRYLGRKSEHQ